MKRLIAVVAVGGGLMIPASSAMGDASGYCGASANGCAAAASAGAQCGSGAASGAFGAFGTYGYIHDFRGGANGPATGDNNSDICGADKGNP
jgi:hypothetical protein